jgi:serine/threonine protein kinase
MNHYHPHKNPKQLFVRVDISKKEHEEVLQEMKEYVRKENRPKKNVEYYKRYLKHLFDRDLETSEVEHIVTTLENARNYVKGKMSFPLMSEKNWVRELLKQNQYFSRSISRPGVIVKLFKTNGLVDPEKEVIVKVYLYDNHCKSVLYSVEESILNEIVFQKYARTLNRTLDFISPELYSYGEIMNYLPYQGAPFYKCQFLIMEYIPHITLKNALYNAETMKHIYERVDAIDSNLKMHLLHHNDLHDSNILVNATNPTSPYPEICLIDFGEADYGTTKSLQRKQNNITI